MADWWNSVAAMHRLTRKFAVAATTLLMLGLTMWIVTGSLSVIAIGEIVLGTAAVACALFAWFRLEHLRELDRLGR